MSKTVKTTMKKKAHESLQKPKSPKKEKIKHRQKRRIMKAADAAQDIEVQKTGKKSSAPQKYNSVGPLSRKESWTRAGRELLDAIATAVDRIQEDGHGMTYRDVIEDKTVHEVIKNFVTKRCLGLAAIGTTLEEVAELLDW